MERPQNSKLGLRVRRITISTGTKKTRNTFSELGRFMGASRREVPPEGLGHRRFTIVLVQRRVNTSWAVLGSSQGRKSFCIFVFGVFLQMNYLPGLYGSKAGNFRTSGVCKAAEI